MIIPRPSGIFQRNILLFYNMRINKCNNYVNRVFPGGASGKEPDCQCKRPKRCGFDPWVGKIPWRRAWQPTPVFLPGESHRQGNLAVYSPQVHTELDTTEETEHARTHALLRQEPFSVYCYSLTAYHRRIVLCAVTQLCLSLSDTMDYGSPDSSVHGVLRQEYWSGLPCSSPGDLPHPGIEPMSPALAGWILYH